MVLLAVLALSSCTDGVVVPDRSAYWSIDWPATPHPQCRLPPSGPFFDVIRYRIRSRARRLPAQVCITRDNVQVGVDGILYMKVLNPERASYGISDFLFAISQLAQTTLRSEVGKIDLDKSFEERTNINTSVVSELDKATESWGVKVLRYEIKNIQPRPTSRGDGKTDARGTREAWR